MKKSLKISLAAMTVAGAMALQSCQKDDRFEPQFNRDSHENHDFRFEKESTFYGPTVSVGQGVARAWVRQNYKGDPVAIGLDLSEKALMNLPDQMTQYVLFFPKNKGKNFYTHMLVDWNPQGHEPEHVYDIPHFDFHFYFVPNEQRLAIVPLPPTQLDIAPDALFVPENYILTGGIVPQMGAHWVDVTSDEFQGKTFTKTYIWGSYHGEFIFFEPMITRAYLLTKPDDRITLWQPSAYQRTGWYPDGYKIQYQSKPGSYTIALTGLTKHEGELD